MLKLTATQNQLLDILLERFAVAQAGLNNFYQQAAAELGVPQGTQVSIDRLIKDRAIVLPGEDLPAPAENVAEFKPDDTEN